MQEIYKEISISDKSEMRLQIGNAYCGRSIRLEKDYLQNGEIINGFTLSQWDDYGFDVFIGNSEYTASVKFIIDINDPLFFCFHRLLNDLEELSIDSDEYEENKRLLIIRKTNDYDIELEFKSKSIENGIRNYYVFIKNIGFDLRSKIDCYNLDTKKRLFEFFEDIKNTLLEEHHQITIDEYMLIRRLKKEKM